MSNVKAGLRHSVQVTDALFQALRAIYLVAGLTIFHSIDQSQFTLLHAMAFSIPLMLFEEGFSMKPGKSCGIVGLRKDLPGLCILLQSIAAILLTGGLTYLFLVSEIF